MSYLSVQVRLQIKCDFETLSGVGSGFLKVLWRFSGKAGISLLWTMCSIFDAGRLSAVRTVIPQKHLQHEGRPETFQTILME